jgi:hypothetical protein
MRIRWAGLVNILTDLINALPGNSFVNTAQHATTEEVLFSYVRGDVTQRWVMVT